MSGILKTFPGRFSTTHRTKHLASGHNLLQHLDTKQNKQGEKAV